MDFLEAAWLLSATSVVFWGALQSGTACGSPDETNKDRGVGTIENQIELSTGFGFQGLRV